MRAVLCAAGRHRRAPDAAERGQRRQGLAPAVLCLRQLRPLHRRRVCRRRGSVWFPYHAVGRVWGVCGPWAVAVLLPGLVVPVFFFFSFFFLFLLSSLSPSLLSPPFVLFPTGRNLCTSCATRTCTKCMLPINAANDPFIEVRVNCQKRMVLGGLTAAYYLGLTWSPQGL